VTVELQWVAPRVLTNVRHRDPAAAGLPQRPNTTAELGDGLAVWLGPDEWLIIDGPWSPPAGPAAEQRWRAVTAAATDVSGQWRGLRVTGPGAAELLPFACALDLAGVGVGGCAQTLIARLPAVLLHPTTSGYELLVRPSHASYLHSFLVDALDGLAG
jgi:sarcosine oxidase subunit gamma